jgi:cobalt-zinc-cadmium efflux system outer membrane protein
MRRDERVTARRLLGAAALWTFGCGAANAGEPVTLEASVRRALERSPGVIEALANVEAARAMTAGASLLSQDNPEVEFLIGSRKTGEIDDSEYELSVAQAIDLWGRRAARRDVAAATLAAAEARLEDQRAAAAAQARQAFGRALAAHQQETLAASGLALALEALAAATERYDAGSASRIELNAARLEVGRRRRAALDAERRSASALADLRLLLGMGHSDDLLLEGELPTKAETRDLDGAALAKAAIERRADLAAARRDLDAARGEERLGAREALPLPKIGASYAQEEDAKVVLGSISWDLPLFNRNQTARGVGSARVRQAQAVVEALERRVAEEVALAVDRWMAARLTLEAFQQEDLAALDENVALTTEGYEAGQIDFVQLLLARRDMLEVRSGFIDAQEALNASEADLDRAIGLVTGLPPGR